MSSKKDNKLVKSLVKERMMTKLCKERGWNIFFRDFVKQKRKKKKKRKS